MDPKLDALISAQQLRIAKAYIEISLLLAGAQLGEREEMNLRLATERSLGKDFTLLEALEKAHDPEAIAEIQGQITKALERASVFLSRAPIRRQLLPVVRLLWGQSTHLPVPPEEGS